MAGITHTRLAPPAVAGLTALVLAACATPTQQVPEPETDRHFLRNVESRISDEVIAQDRLTLQQLRDRLKRINQAGRPANDYHLCKASAWLDMAFDEYTDNDRSPVVDAAMHEAYALITAMEAGQRDITLATPVIANTPKVRDDLWQFADDMKRNGALQNHACIACDLAKMEVHTVWIGHEYQTLGWRLAEPEILAAERYQRAVKSGLTKDCPVPTRATKALGVVPVMPTMADIAPVAVPSCAINAPSDCPTIELLVPDRVHFAFNSSSLTKASRAVLTRIAQTLHQQPDIRVTLEGQADKKGTSQYNQRLALARAKVVHAFLLHAGVDATRLSIKALGAVEGDNIGSDLQSRALVRAVRLRFTNVHGISVVTQTHDVQADR